MARFVSFLLTLPMLFAVVQIASAETEMQFQLKTVELEKIDALGNPAEDVRSFRIQTSHPVEKITVSIWEASRSTLLDTPYLTTVISGGDTLTSFYLSPGWFDKKLLPNADYYYRVTAYKRGATSDRNNTFGDRFTTSNFAPPFSVLLAEEKKPSNADGTFAEAERDVYVTFSAPAKNVGMKVHRKDTNVLILDYVYPSYLYQPGQKNFALGVVSGLLPNTTYHYVVSGVDALANITTLHEGEFTTSGTYLMFEKFEIAPKTIKAGDTATITWNALGATSCQARTEWAPSDHWKGSKPVSGSEVVTPDRTIDYFLKCSNSRGYEDEINGAVVVNGSVEKSATQRISNVTLENLTTTSVSIRWTTSEPSSDLLYFGTSPEKMTPGGVPGSRTSHSVTRENLKSESMYYYRVEANDSNGAVVKTDTKSFTTPNAPHASNSGTAPEELVVIRNEISASVKDAIQLKKSLKTYKKPLQFFAVDIPTLTAKIDARIAAVNAVASVFAGPDGDEVIEKYNELDSFDGGLLMQAIKLMQRDYAILKNVKSKALKKELADVAALIGESINAGDYEDAHDGLLTFTKEIEKNQKLYLAKNVNKKNQKKLTDALQKLETALRQPE